MKGVEQLVSESLSHIQGMTDWVRTEWKRAVDPFPHVVIDNFFPDDMAEYIDRFYPDLRAKSEGRTKKAWAREKYYQRDPTPQFEPIFALLNGTGFREWLTAVTGFNDLLADSEDNEGGGFHEIGPGGFLNVHADFNVHPRQQWIRRLNLLYYANRDWSDEWAGHLELWDTEMDHCVKRITPQLNTAVLFNTGGKTYHGHPEPLKCPMERSRRSLAFYYYQKLTDNVRPHGTIYQARPGTKDPVDSRPRKRARPMKK